MQGRKQSEFNECKAQEAQPLGMKNVLNRTDAYSTITDTDQV